MSDWLVGKKAVANALGVSVTTVKRYLKRYPNFPVNRRGGTNYVLPEALDAWVERREVQNCPSCGMFSREVENNQIEMYCYLFRE